MKELKNRPTEKHHREMQRKEKADFFSDMHIYAHEYSLSGKD